MYRVFHKANAFNRLKHGVELSSPYRTKVRTNDLQSEQLPVLVRYAMVWKFPRSVTSRGRISANSIQKRAWRTFWFG
jgi:hypothetical protein